MKNEQIIAQHYHHGSLLNTIIEVLGKGKKSLNALSLDDLALIDEFHIGGRIASQHFFAQLPLKEQNQVLDIGCGLGGAARFVAQTYGARVTGIDLTKEYIATGNVLSQWLKLTNNVKLYQGSALTMPFTKDNFNCAYMMHVGMNIENKQQLFNEVFRLLKINAYFGIYDVLRQNDGELNYPLPWATEQKNSYLATIEQYKTYLVSAGFEVIVVNNRRDFALDFFAQIKQKNKLKNNVAKRENNDLSVLGLHTLMRSSSHEKLTNLRINIENYTIAPIEIIARKCGL